MNIKNFKQYNVSNDRPDWSSGSDFGNPRRASEATIKKYTGITKSVQTKIESFEKKKLIILEKWRKDPNLNIAVRKKHMENTTKVSAREAIDLCDKAINHLRVSKDNYGIVVYVR